jgi:predicted adenylyl cyclase CyaB
VVVVSHWSSAKSFIKGVLAVVDRNIEIKAVLRDRARAKAWALERAGSGPEVLEQEDIFFNCEGARLKLRILGPTRGELIRYERTDAAEVRLSRYEIARTEDPQVLREILTKALGVVGVVKKTRLLYLVGQTRVHLDCVEGLGDFLELEVVLRPDQSEEDGKAIAEGMLADLGLGRNDCLAEAYVDMLAAHSA